MVQLLNMIVGLNGIKLFTLVLNDSIIIGTFEYFNYGIQMKYESPNLSMQVHNKNTNQIETKIATNETRKVIRFKVKNGKEKAIKILLIITLLKKMMPFMKIPKKAKKKKSCFRCYYWYDAIYFKVALPKYEKDDMVRELSKAYSTIMGNDRVLVFLICFAFICIDIVVIQLFRIHTKHDTQTNPTIVQQFYTFFFLRLHAAFFFLICVNVVPSY